MRLLAVLVTLTALVGRAVAGKQFRADLALAGRPPFKRPPPYSLCGTRPGLHSEMWVSEAAADSAHSFWQAVRRSCRRRPSGVAVLAGCRLRCDAGRVRRPLLDRASPIPLH